MVQSQPEEIVLKTPTQKRSQVVELLLRNHEALRSNPRTTKKKKKKKKERKTVIKMCLVFPISSFCLSLPC
jgi:hypothetical protein